MKAKRVLMVCLRREFVVHKQAGRGCLSQQQHFTCVDYGIAQRRITIVPTLYHGPIAAVFECKQGALGLCVPGKRRSGLRLGLPVNHHRVVCFGRTKPITRGGIGAINKRAWVNDPRRALRGKFKRECIGMSMSRPRLGPVPSAINQHEAGLPLPSAPQHNIATGGERAGFGRGRGSRQPVITCQSCCAKKPKQFGWCVTCGIFPLTAFEEQRPCGQRVTKIVARARRVDGLVRGRCGGG